MFSWQISTCKNYCVAKQLQKELAVGRVKPKTRVNEKWLLRRHPDVCSKKVGKAVVLFTTAIFLDWSFSSLSHLILSQFLYLISVPVVFSKTNLDVKLLPKRGSQSHQLTPLTSMSLCYIDSFIPGDILNMKLRYLLISIHKSKRHNFCSFAWPILKTMLPFLACSSFHNRTW